MWLCELDRDCEARTETLETKLCLYSSHSCSPLVFWWRCCAMYCESLFVRGGTASAHHLPLTTALVVYRGSTSKRVKQLRLDFSGPRIWGDVDERGREREICQQRRKVEFHFRVFGMISSSSSPSSSSSSLKHISRQQRALGSILWSTID